MPEYLFVEVSNRINAIEVLFSVSYRGRDLDLT